MLSMNRWAALWGPPSNPWSLKEIALVSKLLRFCFLFLSKEDSLVRKRACCENMTNPWFNVTDDESPSWEPIFSIEILSPRLPSLGHTWNCDLALAAEFLLGDPFFPTQVDAPPESPGSGPRVQAIFTLPLPSSYTPASSQPWQMEMNKLFNYSHRRLQHFLCDQRGYNIQFEYDILMVDSISSNPLSEPRNRFESNFEKILWQLRVPTGIWNILFTPILVKYRKTHFHRKNSKGLPSVKCQDWCKTTFERIRSVSSFNISGN